MPQLTTSTVPAGFTEATTQANGITVNYVRGGSGPPLVLLHGYPKFGLLVLLEAKPGKGDDLRAFLEAGRALAAAEEGTVTWYAFKASDASYGIFGTFGTEDARDAHLGGQIPGPWRKQVLTCWPAIPRSALSTSSLSSRGSSAR